MKQTIVQMFGRLALGWTGAIVLFAAAILVGLGAGAPALALGPQGGDCINCPDPDDGGQIPSNATSTPHIAFEFRPCLPAELSGDVLQALRDGIANGLDAIGLSPYSDVRGGICSADGRQRVGVWVTRPGLPGISSDTPEARDRGVRAINLLLAGEEFAVRFHAIGLRTMLDRFWAITPHHYTSGGAPVIDEDGDGQLDGDPDVYLRFYVLDYFNSTLGSSATKRLRTTVVGYYDGPTADTDFWVKVTDRMWLENGRIRCDSSVQVDIEDTFDSVIAAIFNVAGQDAETLIADFVNQGPGCPIVSALPSQLMLPGTFWGPGGTPRAFKEVFNVQRLDVNSTSGITAAGEHHTAFREPVVVLDGPDPLHTEIGEPITGTYTARTGDLRPPLSVSWSSPDATVEASGLKATFTWDLGFIGNGVVRNVTVHVTDADGLHASDTMSVSILRDTVPQPDDCPPSVIDCI